MYDTYEIQAKHETKTFLETTISSYYSTTERSDAVTLMWNHLMAHMSCCGVNDYKDFELSDNWTTYKHNRTIPEACCVLSESDVNGFIPRDSSCPYGPTDANSYWKKVSPKDCIKIFNLLNYVNTGIFTFLLGML